MSGTGSEEVNQAPLQVPLMVMSVTSHPRLTGGLSSPLPYLHTHSLALALGSGSLTPNPRATVFRASSLRRVGLTRPVSGSSCSAFQGRKWSAEAMCHWLRGRAVSGAHSVVGLDSPWAPVSP